ncbi:hypothetical protein J3458_005574 [Metarhizium acridum]|uniref:uncharacterized protein n=1 Tax=Metarhizium acridum TaxID=92637 RepID=UPI001C6ACCE4|nr:hypothetical protein J3458_005574 [Metarhizium acridum]
MRRVVRSVEPQPYCHVLALHDDHEKWYAALPPCLKIWTGIHLPGTTPSYRLILEMMHFKGLCVLHRPYLSAHKHDNRYAGSRRILPRIRSQDTTSPRRVWFGHTARRQVV